MCEWACGGGSGAAGVNLWVPEGVSLTAIRDESAPQNLGFENQPPRLKLPAGDEHPGIGSPASSAQVTRPRGCPLGSATTSVMLRPRLLWLAILTVASCTEWRGVTVTLKNAGEQGLDSVVVYVTGRAYHIGSLAPEEQRSVRVRPTSESHVEIEHRGQLRRLVLDTYFEPGYHQHIRARITRDSVLTLQITEPY